MKTTLKVLAGLLVLIVLPMMAGAGEALLTCTKPTKNTDGTAYTNHAGFRYLWGKDATDLDKTTYVDGAALPCEYTVKGLTNGTWYFGVMAYNTVPQESALSNVVSKVITDLPPETPPLPPTATVTATEVFQVIGTTDQFQFLPVGTVPPTTLCIGSQKINGYYAVPIAAVTWYGSVRPRVVVAKCD